ncbi:hypothetical protein BC829DRAFT_387604 [Chytridium lagenaria]|nr:hypothetical protein BC829DRAFT_387604 [Chytridium lagenaria]
MSPPLRRKFTIHRFPRFFPSFFCINVSFSTSLLSTSSKKRFILFHPHSLSNSPSFSTTELKKTTEALPVVTPTETPQTDDEAVAKAAEAETIEESPMDEEDDDEDDDDDNDEDVEMDETEDDLKNDLEHLDTSAILPTRTRGVKVEFKDTEGIPPEEEDNMEEDPDVVIEEDEEDEE